MAYIQVMTAVDKKKKAKDIGKYLLEKRVAACIQIIPMESMYWWKKKLTKTKEFLLIIKGKDFNEIKKEIKKVHPYETPEIVKMDITKANKDYLKWIDKEVKNG